MANTRPGILQILRDSFWNPNHDKRSIIDGINYYPEYYSTGSTSGEIVTETNGSRISTVFNCINLIAQDVAQTPFSVYRNTNLGRQEQPQNPAAYLINERSNDYMSAYSWTYSMVYSYLVHGNGYSYILRDSSYNPIALLPLHPNSVTLDVVDGYVYATVDGIGAVSYDDILHYKLYTIDGLRGISPIMHNAELMGKRLKEHRYSAQTLGAKPPGYLSSATADEQQQVTIAKQWKSAVSNNEVNGTPFLIGDTKYNPLTFTAEQTQFIESTIRTNIEIYGIFRVQPTMVSNFDQGVKANAEQQAINHVKFTLMPHFTMIEDEVNYKLFSESNKKNRVDPYYAWHDSDIFLRGDMVSRYQAYHNMIVDGVFNANDVRLKENMTKQPDGIGDKYYIQGAMIEKGKEQDNGQGNEGI